MCRYYFLFLLCAALPSCDDRLDIEPLQAISTSSALDDINGLRTAIVGMYSLYVNTFNGQSHPILHAEYLANTDDLIWTGFNIAHLNTIFEKSIPTTNQTVEDFWINSYRIINQANTIEEALPNVEMEEDVSVIAGELRFMRGMIYFELVELFASPWSKGNADVDLGVPIVATPAEETLKDSFTPRSTVSEVYQFIIDDLSYARDNLPKQNGFYPSTYSASALLTRVYLNQENFDLARQEADRVIGSDQFELLGNYDEVFNQVFNSGEDIFSIQITSEDGTNHMSHFFSGELEGGGGFLGITEDHVNKYDSTDLRGLLFYLDQQFGIRRTAKWIVQPSFDGNVTLLRLAEMYLTRAEARFRSGDIQGAAADINIIRARAGLDPLSPDTLNIDVILHERYLELAFEGHVLRDRKRTRRAFGNLPFDHPSLVFPIPQREMDINPALVQNQGY